MSVVIIIVTALITITNSWHVIEAWIIRPPHTFFTGIAHYYADYFLYVSQMEQGARGAWIFASDLFTNEPLSPTWIYWLNVSLGHIGHFIRLSPFVTYNVSVAIFAVLVLFFWWCVIRQLFPKLPRTQSIAFLLIATASNFPGLGNFWFFPTPALNRLGGVPHQMLQTILILVVIMLFSELIDAYHSSGRQKDHTAANIVRNPSLYLLAAASFVAATANPIQMALVVPAAFATSLVWTYFERRVLKKDVIAMLSLVVPALVGAVVTNAEFARQPVLTAAKLWEASQPFHLSLVQFVLALGPIVVFIPFGIRPFFQKLTPLKVIVALYTLAAVIVFFSPLPKILGTSPVRWLSPAAYGLLPIIGAVGMMQLTILLSHLSSKFKNAEKILFMSFTILYTVFTIPSLMSQVEARMPAPSSLNYVPNNVIEALVFVQDSQRDGVVLTDPALPYDVLVPAFTGKRSFTGHPIHTLYPSTKADLRHRFFEGAMTESDRERFVRDHDIGYILASPATAEKLVQYKDLTQVFQNESIIIFAVHR